MANTTDASNEAAVMVACFAGAKFDANMYAALMGISATAASGRYYHIYKPAVIKLIDAAKADGRLKADGTANPAALTAPRASPRGKKSTNVANLNSVKTGRVSKKSAARGKKVKREEEADTPSPENSAGDTASDSE